MLIAEVDGFWKAPSVYDVATIVGLLLGIGSIWFSWWLAKRDMQAQIDDAARKAAAAARDEVHRVARAVLQSGVSEAIRDLELAREACEGKRWPRAADLCILARQHLARVLAQPAADDRIQADLRGVTASLQDALARLRDQPRGGTGTTPAEVYGALDDSLLALHRVEGRMTGISAEGDGG